MIVCEGAGNLRHIPVTVLVVPEPAGQLVLFLVEGTTCTIAEPNPRPHALHCRQVWRFFIPSAAIVYLMHLAPSSGKQTRSYCCSCLALAPVSESYSPVHGLPPSLGNPRGPIEVAVVAVSRPRRSSCRTAPCVT